MVYNKRAEWWQIIDGSEAGFEEIEKIPIEVDAKIAQDIAINLQIQDIVCSKESTNEIKEHKIKDHSINTLKQKLNYSYDEFGDRNDPEYLKKRSKNALVGPNGQEEILLIHEKEKIEKLIDLKKKGIIIDQLKFIDESEDELVCVGEIFSIVPGSKDKKSHIFIVLEMILNSTGDVQFPERDDKLLEISVDQIDEIIVDEKRYKFL